LAAVIAPGLLRAFGLSSELPVGLALTAAPPSGYDGAKANY